MSASEPLRSGTRIDFRLGHQQFSIAALMSKKEDNESGKSSGLNFHHYKIPYCHCFQ